MKSCFPSTPVLNDDETYADDIARVRAHLGQSSGNYLRKCRYSSVFNLQKKLGTIPDLAWYRETSQCAVAFILALHHPFMLIDFTRWVGRMGEKISEEVLQSLQVIPMLQSSTTEQEVEKGFLDTERATSSSKRDRPVSVALPEAVLTLELLQRYHFVQSKRPSADSIHRWMFRRCLGPVLDLGLYEDLTLAMGAAPGTFDTHVRQWEMEERFCSYFIKFAEELLFLELQPQWKEYRMTELENLRARMNSPSFSLADLVLDRKENIASYDSPGHVAATNLHEFAAFRPNLRAKALKKLGNSVQNEKKRTPRQTLSGPHSGKAMSPDSPRYALSFLMMVGMRASVDAGLYLQTLDQGATARCEEIWISKYASDESKTSEVIDTPSVTFPLVGLQQFTLTEVPLLPNVGFTFSDVAQETFAWIRKQCGISTESYLDSICRTDFAFIEFTSNSQSGQFFFFSWDSRFMIKTISAAEARRVTEFVPDYAAHLARNPDSLLSRIFGLHRVQIQLTAVDEDVRSPGYVETDSYA
eukprot:GHVN01073404.1.p1 GENE.GHVN01073404.1~~GHVN01073404.1.p1  ORF type:complete len:528 (+),score=18.53 GHVN01073404.1:131-1714(+)